MIVVAGLGGLPRLRGRTAEMAARLGRSAALHEAGAALQAWVDRNFERRGALMEGAGWPPLAAATLAARRRRGLGSRPLQATGRLRASITLRAGPSRATLGSAVPYAAAHQEGRGVPRRAIFPDAAQAARIVLPAVRAHVAEALAKEEVAR